MNLECGSIYEHFNDTVMKVECGSIFEHFNDIVLKLECGSIFEHFNDTVMKLECCEYVRGSPVWPLKSRSRKAKSSNCSLGIGGEVAGGSLVWSTLWSLPSYKTRYVFLYSAVSSPLDSSKRFTFFALPGRPVHSDTNSASLGSILARQQLRAMTKSLTFRPLSIARYSFIQLSELGQCGKTKMPNLQNGSKGRIRTWAPLIESPVFYHWATALHEHHATSFTKCVSV